MEITLNAYQTAALQTAVYPNQGANFAYPALGLVGEAGECADKLKKVIRDNNSVLTNSVRDAVAKEIGSRERHRNRIGEREVRLDHESPQSCQRERTFVKRPDG